MRRTLFWSPNKLFRLVLTGRRTSVPALDCLSFSFHSCPSRHSFDLYRPCYLLAKPCQPFSFLFFLSLLSPLSPLLPPPPPPLDPVSRFIPVLFVTPVTSTARYPLLYPVSRFIPVLNPVTRFPFCSSCYSFHLYRPCYPFYFKTLSYY